MKSYFDILNENKQGRVSKNVHFEIDIVSTKHAVERLNRKDASGNDAYEPVKFEEVISVIDSGTEDIINSLVKDENDIDVDRIILQRESDGLTVVGVMKDEGNKLSFVVITIYRGSEFRVGRDQKIIKVKK